MALSVEEGSQFLTYNVSWTKESFWGENSPLGSPRKSHDVKSIIAADFTQGLTWVIVHHENAANSVVPG